MRPVPVYPLLPYTYPIILSIASMGLYFICSRLISDVLYTDYSLQVLL